MLKKKPKKKPLTISQIDNGMRATGGFLTYTAKKLGVTYNAIYARIQKSPQLKRTQAEIQESYLDLTEHSLIKKIKDEDLGAICFFLKCKGKSRGYVEKSLENQQEEQKAQPIQVIIQVEDASKGK
jgi:hypothetical protein